MQKKNLADEYSLWHNRLGHAPVSKLKYISCIKYYVGASDKVCLTCPMSKLTKLPFPDSVSHASKAFDLVHVDIWGPYRVCTRQKFKLFLTLVDDYSRMTWIFLLQRKSEDLKCLEAFQNFIKK